MDHQRLWSGVLCALALSQLGAATLPYPDSPRVMNGPCDHGAVGVRDRLPVRLCASMSLEEKISQMVIGYPIARRGGPVNMGGVIIVGDLLGSETKLRARIASVQARARIPLLVAVDMEGGKLNRLRAVRGLESIPSGREFGRMNEEQVRAWARRIGAKMRSVGFNCSLGPVLDLADSGVMHEMHRSMGADPVTVARLGRAFAAGLLEEGVMPIGKHFPGYGSLGGNSDHALVIADRSAQEIAEQSAPFVAAGDLLAGVMLANVGFHAYDSVPAILSPKLLASAHLNGWVTMTDDLSIRTLAEVTGGDPVEVVRRAFLAGNDILLTTAPVDWKGVDIRREILELVRSRPELVRQVDESVIRILRVKERTGLLDPFRDELRVAEAPAR